MRLSNTVGHVHALLDQQDEIFVDMCTCILLKLSGTEVGRTMNLITFITLL